MLPQKLRSGTVFIGFILLGFSSNFVTTENSNSNVWHEGPINCYTCSTLEECAQQVSFIRKCENNDAQICLTVFDENGAVARRGCSDVIAASTHGGYCKSNPDKCPSCSSSGCNTASSPTEFVECVYCDSALDSNCALNVSAVTTKKLCQGMCMSSFYPSNTGYGFVRSCLNDRDLDDRQNCFSGQDSHCSACQGANCNIQPPDYSCMQCGRTSGVDCEEATMKQCNVFQHLGCYAQFGSEDNDIVAMGCRSDFNSEGEVVELIKKKLLYVCDGSKCNDFGRLPQSNICHKCSSVTEEACATKPKSLIGDVNCGMLPFTQCYQRLHPNGEGATERGCLAELEGEEFYSCLRDADENCKICSGNRCNEEIIPADRLECHRCNSKSDSSCHSNPSALSFCPAYHQNDACVAVFEEGVTKRGCQSEFSCDPNSSKCQLCRDNGCNSKDLKKHADEFFGVFQDLPLNCNTCSGDECQTGRRNPRKCEGDIFQDCLTIFNAKGIVERRGCELLVEAEYGSFCKDHPELCFKCKSNGCNVVSSPSNYQECIYCDTASNSDCLNNAAAVTTKRRCTEGCLSALYRRKGDEEKYELARACFEDLELDDREKCTDNNDCVMCNETALCNANIVPEDAEHLTCYHCQGNDCDEPISKDCANYSLKDQCYIHFENITHSVTSMGCKSDLTHAELSADVKGYFLCNGKNCNAYENLPPAHICLSCNSMDDINCAVNSSAVVSMRRCQNHPFTDCYMRIRSDGTTERGCLQDLSPTDFVECGAGKNCQICSESKCNNVLYPPERQQCYHCNSQDSNDCESSPSDVRVCALHSPGEACVTKVENGTTYRGCTSEFSCDGVSSRLCRTCTDSNCNNEDMSVHVIGDPGVFQDLPLNCYQCSGADECSGKSVGKINKCEGDEKQTCTTVFARDGKVVARGCSDSLDEICSDDGDVDCHYCKSNACNVALQQSEYIDCIFCDAKRLGDCSLNVSSITRTRKCHKSCMTTLYQPNSDPVYEVMRTCLDDLDLDERELCLTGDSKICKACSTDKCNTLTLDTMKTSCYHCSGEECKKPVSHTCRAFSREKKCFVQFNEKASVVEMGCKSDYSEQELISLVKSKRLWLCDGENCNARDKLPSSQVCTICNSATDALCATAPESVLSETTCSTLPYTGCYTRILPSGHSERGCLTSLADDQFFDCLQNTNPDQCLACTGDNCNKELYPSDRLSCHTCNSNSSASCVINPQSAQLCLKYFSDQTCISMFTASGDTVRGCSYEVSGCENSVSCEECTDNNCNTKYIKRQADGKPGKWQPLPLKCYVCHNEKDCADMSVNQTCSVHGYCMTVFNTKGAVIERGCSEEVEKVYSGYCDNNSNNCHNCNSNMCNSAQDLGDYIDCIYCDSKINGDCLSSTTNVSLRRKCHKACMSVLYPRPNCSHTSPCESLFDLTRGCLDDMDTNMQNECKAGSNDNCRACYDDNCNTDLLEKKVLSCLECSGDNCEDPIATRCHQYVEKDQCYLLFNNASDVSRMGCLSDLDVDFVEKNKHLFVLCDDADNCNTFEKIPKPNKCVACNSTFDPACASDPAMVATMEECLVLPHTECITYVTKGGITVRGCVSNLERPQILSCISGLNKNCITCTGSRCNSDIFPEGRRSCHRCNSKEDPTCEWSPNAASICPHYSSTQFCSVKVVNGHTYRGCSMDFQCEESQKQYCRHCKDEDNCNDINLVGVGPPGLWQDLPLNCYSCVDEECANGTGKIQKCEDNELQTCLTVFTADGSVKARGCSDAVTATHGDYCDDHPANCIPCKSSGCNSAANLNEYTDCYFCDSAQSNTCKVSIDNTMRTRKCHGGCMVTLYPSNDAPNATYEVSRSCLDDKDLDDQYACKDGSDAYCHHCRGARCNTMDLSVENHECYHCQEGNCENIVSQKCRAFHSKDQCYILLDQENTITSMGCRSDHEGANLIELIKSKKMVLCDGKNCNSPDLVPTPNDCSVCDSKTDPRCATNPNLVSNKETCLGVPYTECYTRINEAGHTSRGCLSSLDPDTFYNCLMGNDSLCKTCQGTRCNAADIYPPERLQCHQCNSVTDLYCRSSPESNKVCPIYKKDDACLTNIKDLYGDITRGCASSMQCTRPHGDYYCKVCNESGCNNQTLKDHNIIEAGKWQELPLTCHTCKGAKNCQNGDVYRICEGWGVKDSCFTIFDLNDTVVERGCSADFPRDHRAYCKENYGRCTECNSNGCNDAISMDDYVECLACDSRNNRNCVSDVNKMTRTRLCHKHCMTALYMNQKEANPAYSLARTCLDDMDLDDRMECQAGKNEFCEVCSGPKCNTALLPTVRLSCNHCSGNDCETLKRQKCTTYRPDDRCYIRYDKQHSVVAMGCRSAFSNEYADSLLSNNSLFLCEGDNCNTVGAVIPSQTCVLCNSLTDIECATNPEKVKSKTECQNVPNTGCYSRVLHGGQTERGCISSLYGNEFLSCMNGSPTCVHCQGKRCNKQIFPTNRTMCHICDSTEDQTCHYRPNSLTVCPKYVESDTCVTFFNNGITKRGCGSDMVCSANNNKTCVTCSGSGCNTVNLINAQDDNYGRWQDLPLKCLTCTGTACDKATNTTTCENNNQQDCVTVFGTSGKVIRRGCSDELEDQCWKNQENCYRCKSNACNTATRKTEFVDCVYCDTNMSPNCVWDPLNSSHKRRRCQGGCMTTLYSADSSNNMGYDLIRTCLNDKESVDQGICASGSDKNCKACTSDNCNMEEVPTNRLSCFRCIDHECESPKSVQCPIYKVDDKCYSVFDKTNSVTNMGCVSSLRTQDLETLIKTKRVLICDGKDCNIIMPPAHQKCLECSSEKTEKCATNALELSSFQTCSKLPHTGCYTKLTNKGSTERGCLADLPEDDFSSCLLGKDKNCGVCQGDGCNREIFPADRLQCYTCSSEDDPNCESFPNRTLPCHVMSDSETCVTALNDDRTVRGCSSSIYCDSADKKTCRSCIGTACNSIDLRNKKDDGYHGVWQSLPLRCHTCQGHDCLNSLGSAAKCKDNDAQDCMTVFAQNGTVQRRGCSDDVEDYEDSYCRLNPGYCFKCKSNECNVAWSLDEYIDCAYCTSTSDPRCALKAEETDFGTRACYKHCMAALTDGVVVRSCLDDKDLKMQNVCKINTTGNDCASCSSSNCNKFVHPPNLFSCHKCSDKYCSESVSEVCRYDETQCFARYANGRVDLMGCLSSQNASDIADWSAQKRLYQCEGKDCNEISKLPAPSVCVACNSDQMSECAQNPELVKTVKECMVPRGECMTSIYEDGRTWRGCASDLSVSEERNCIDKGTCTLCNNSQCNTEIFPSDRRRCFICNSDANATCAGKPNTHNVCLKYDPDDLCVSRRTEDGFVQRGCASDTLCSASDKNTCDYCNTDYCNNIDFSGGASFVVGSLTMTLLLVVVAVLAGNH